MGRLSATLDHMRALSQGLQRRITEALAAIDGGAFAFADWERREGGGGRMGVLRGEVLEKAAVNVSFVHGDRNPFTGQPFAASGLSLIVHPANPHAPAVHLNVRYFEEATGRAWHGGGMDLTPMGFPYDEDTRHFHAVAAEAVASAGFDPATARARADEYFHVAHRGRPRGVGGVFFDEVPASEKSRALIEALGNRFLDAYLPILRRRVGTPTNAEERAVQLRARGVYVEFNLLYDKGTRFGFESGGNPDAILASLPPLVRW